MGLGILLFLGPGSCEAAFSSLATV